MLGACGQEWERRDGRVRGVRIGGGEERKDWRGGGRR